MEKLMALASIGQKAYARWLFLRLMAGVALVGGITIVASILMGALLVGGFYAAYLALLHYGISQITALLIVGGAIILLLLIIAVTIVVSARRLQSLPSRLLKKKAPLVSQADDIIEAFFDGLLGVEKSPH